METQRPDRRSSIKQALLRIEQLERENARLRQTEPVAVLGMACRLPGGVTSPRELWELLARGGDAVSEVPASRWPLALFYDDDLQAPGKTYSRHGGFLAGDPALFDAAFFGISPVEARVLDPQQRLLLEVSWEALENAGLAPDRLRGSRTGVFVGISGSEYLQALLRATGTPGIGPYHVTGSIGSTAVGRIAYTFDFRGPAVAVDTACSSSLIAVDQACASLRQGTADLALAGGVNLILGPEGHVCFSRMKALSAGGRCRTFDAAADGFVRGEGCGVVVLKRLSDALAAGDPVLAVIRGSAVNQDGRSNGLTAPSLLAQRDVIHRALEQAGAAPAEVSYVEAHGTGTPLGDPIEIEALAGVLCQDRREPLWIGSVKTNLGHLEAAAGIAGLIKVVLALQHGEIPPHLHFERPNPHIPWADLPLRVPVQRTPWAANGSPRRAGLSSFGFGGTNGHVVLEEAPPASSSAPAPAAARATDLHYLLCISAQSPEALDRLAAGYAGCLADAPEIAPADLCAAAGGGRSHFRHRLAAVGSTADEMQRLLRGERRGGELFRGEAAAAPPKVVFVFTGQGSHYVGMGYGLWSGEPRFREALERCAGLLAPHLDRPLLSLFDPKRPEAELLGHTAYAQPALFALEYALAELWRSWGVEPAALAGHSLGEYVAACLAGVFSLEDALALVAERGRLMQELPRAGRMAVVFAPVETVEEEVRPFAGRLAVAAVNAPENVVVAGEAEALEELLARCAGRGLRTRSLPGEHAFHSPLMDPVLPAFERVAAAVRYAPPTLPVISNLTGDGSADLANPRYWVEHLRQRVRFADSIRHLAAGGHGVFLEIGPAPVLAALGRQIAPEGIWLASLRRSRPDRLQMLASAAQLYVCGASLDWQALAGRPRRMPALPNYPFERQRYWFEDDNEKETEGVMRAVETTDGDAVAARRGSILSTLQRIVADTSGADVRTVDPAANLLDLGLDSLMLMQIRQEVERRLGVEVPVSEMFQDLSTLEKLAAYLAVRTRPAPPAAAPAAAPPVAVPAPSPPPAPTAFVAYRSIDTTSATQETDARKRAHLATLIERYEETTRESKERTQAFRPVFANNRNIAGFRPAWKELIYQVIAERAAGSKIWALGGREFLDMTMGFGVHFFGHRPDFVAAAVEREMRRGMPLGPMSPLAGEVAQRLCRMTGAERAAFYNTGTEAVMVALRVARTVTGRSRIVLFEGSYHGSFDGILALPRRLDGVLSTVPGSPGTTQGMVDDVLVLKYGDPAALERIRAEAGELAAVLVEPVQSRRPDLRPREFLHELRRITAASGTALIFDEIVVGFRAHPGGAQALFDVRADLATYGKVLGGGLPIGVVAGRTEWMDAVDGGMWTFGDDSVPRRRNTFVAGTFCHHPLAMAAALAVLDRLETEGPALQEELNRRTAGLCGRLNAWFDAEQVPIRIEHFGSLFRFFLRGDLELLFYHLIEKGIYIWEGRNCFLSTAHTDEDLERFHQAVVESVLELRRGGYIPAPARPRPAPVPSAVDSSVADRSLDFSLFYFSTSDEAGAPGESKYRLLVEGAKFADRHGFTAVWTPERHFHSFGGLYPNPAITGAALATATERVRLRAGSTVLLLHDPVRFAENWSMVDNLSGGRVDVAIALGWNSNDFVFAPETFERRAELLPARLDTVRRLWRGETLTGAGGKGEEVRVQLFPRPVQPELPIWFPAAGNPETFREAGRLGFNVLTYLESQTLEELAAKIALYRQTRREHGHEPHGHVTLMLHTLVGTEREAALATARPHLQEYLRSSYFQRSQLLASLGIDLEKVKASDLDVILGRAVERYLGDRALVGDIDSCVAMAERLRALGVDEVACLIDFGVGFEAAMEGLTHLDEVRRRCQAAAAREGAAAAATDRLPLSEGQRELWAFVQEGPEASLAYNESVLLGLSGPLDETALGAAWRALAARHEALRLGAPDGRWQKRLHGEVQLETSHLPEAAWLDQEGRRPFDLAGGPLFRLGVLRRAADDHLLLLTAHHLVANGWSLGVMIEELAALYSAACRGEAAALPEPVPFSAYLRWRDEQAQRRGPHEAYWLQKLAAPWTALELPADAPPPARPDHAGARRVARVEGPLYAALKAAAREHGVTLFMLVLAAFEALLARLTGQERIAVGVPVSEQAAMGAVRLVGHCTSLLPVCVETAEAETFDGLLARVKTAVLEAFDHQNVSFAALAGRETRFAVPPLTVLFNMDRAPALPSFAGVAAQLLPAPVRYVKFDLSLNALETEGGLALDLDYRTRLFEAATIERWTGWLLDVLAAVAGDPRVPLAELPPGEEIAGPDAERVWIAGRAVEPRRVAAVLRLLAADAAVVAAPDEETGETGLTAYVVEPAAGLRRRLGELLPPWQVPARIVRLAALPDAARYDAAALAALPVEDETGPTPPADDVEARLLAIWEEVLRRRGIDVHDDFFLLGGNSLKAAQLLLRIQRELGLEAGLGELLGARTVASLARVLRGSAQPAPPAIPRLESQADFPLSHAQKRLWIFQQRDSGSAAYNIAVGAWLDGSLNAAALRQALEAVVERHEALRTTFQEQAGEPRQRIGPAVLPFEEIDLAGEEGEQDLVLSMARDEAVRPFDLQRGPLVRARLLRVSARRSALLLTVHHIVADGGSMEVLVRDTGRLYRAFAAGAVPELPPLPVQYRDYAGWQARRAAAAEAGRRFWLGVLRDPEPPPVLDLPTDAPRPAIQTFRGAVVRMELPPEVAAGLRRLAGERGASLFTVLLAAVQALLHRVTGQDDIVIGAPVSGRNHPDLEDQVGLYVNTLPLRGRVDAGEPFTGLLERVRRELLAALEHADYPLDLLLAELGGARDWSRAALFNALVALDDEPALLDDELGTSDWGGLRLTPLALDPQASLFELSFHFTARSEGIGLALVYNGDLFKRERIESLGERFLDLLADLSADPAKPVGALSFETARSRERGALELVKGFDL